jgi:hypothetical protein
VKALEFQKISNRVHPESVMKITTSLGSIASRIFQGVQLLAARIKRCNSLVFNELPPPPFSFGRHNPSAGIRTDAVFLLSGQSPCFAKSSALFLFAIRANSLDQNWSRYRKGISYINKEKRNNNMKSRYIIPGIILVVYSVAQAQESATVTTETTVRSRTVTTRSLKVLDELSAKEAKEDPYRFIQKTISRCDVVKAQIETQQIELRRLENFSNRKISEGKSADRRYNKFLVDAKAAYQAAKANDGTVKWPLNIGGFMLDEVELEDKVLDAQERIERAAQQISKNELYLKRIKVRQDLFRVNLRDLASYRATLTEKAEDVKMNQIIGEVADIAEVIGGLKDMELAVSTKISLDELTHEDPDTARRQGARKFLNN